MAFTVLGNVPVWYLPGRRAEGRGRRTAEDRAGHPRLVREAEQAAGDLRSGRAHRARQRHPLRMVAMDGEPRRHRREGPGERRLHRHLQQPAEQGDARPVHRGREEVRRAQSRRDQPRGNHPAACHRQGAAGRSSSWPRGATCRTRKSRRWSARSSAVPIPRAADGKYGARDRQLELRDSEGHQLRRARRRRSRSRSGSRPTTRSTSSPRRAAFPTAPTCWRPISPRIRSWAGCRRISRP